MSAARRRLVARSGSGPGGQSGVAVLHLPGVVHHVMGRPPDEELDRPGSSGPALGVVRPDRGEVGGPVRRQPLRGQDNLARRANLDLSRELVRLTGIHVADDRSRLRPALRGPDGAPPGREPPRRRSRPSRPAGGRAGVPGPQAESTSRSICDGTWAIPQKSVELDPGTRSATCMSPAARAKASSRPARSATPA